MCIFIWLNTEEASFLFCLFKVIWLIAFGPVPALKVRQHKLKYLDKRIFCSPLRLVLLEYKVLLYLSSIFSWRLFQLLTSNPIQLTSLGAAILKLLYLGWTAATLSILTSSLWWVIDFSKIRFILRNWIHSLYESLSRWCVSGMDIYLYFHFNTA